MQYTPHSDQLGCFENCRAFPESKRLELIVHPHLFISGILHILISIVGHTRHLDSSNLVCRLTKTSLKDSFWIYSKILNFSQLMTLFESSSGTQIFYAYGVPGEGDFNNFHWSESNQIWYAASLHHSLGLFLDLFKNIEFFETYDTFRKLIQDLNILRIWGTW